MDARAHAEHLARQGWGRKRIAEATGLSPYHVARVIQAVRGVSTPWGHPAAAEAVEVQTLDLDDADDPTDALAELLGQAKEGVPVGRLADYPEGALAELERRGFAFALVAGRVRLERAPESRVNEAAVEGVFDPTRAVHRFAVISDTHFGGRQAQPWWVREVLVEAARRGCSVVLHVGDHVDGPPAMHKGFEHELLLTRVDDQADFTASIYRESTVPILGIGGNHDGSWFKQAGLDVCRMIEERAGGAFRNIGPISGWVAGPDGHPEGIRLFHPGDGASYALSYKDQKTAEHLAIGQERSPRICHLTGHYHKFNLMRGPQGARYVLAPSACASTPFMRAKRLANMAGALFCEFTLSRTGQVDRFLLEDVMLPPDAWRPADYEAPPRPKAEPRSAWGAR
jgi:predicted phosphodiesterase